MKNPETLIYVILIVGSLIWSIVKKFAAKKAETAQPNPQPAPTSRQQRTLEDIFREMAGEIEPQPVVVKPQPQPVSKPKPIMNDSFAKRSIFKHTPQQETPQHHFDVDLENTSDWQRAFVYSEIFNRKY